MQPNLVITAPESGMIYINGHFAGECSEKHPLMRAINATGAVYIEYRPLSERFLSMARRIVFSGGFPLAESAEEEDVRIICWPGKITEMELMPAEARPPAPMLFESGGRGFVIDSRRRLMRGDRMLAQLPKDAEIPRWRQLDCGGIFMGNYPGGMYLVTGNREMAFANGFLQAKRIEIEDDGRIRAFIDRADTAGHGRLENWRLEAEGLKMISAESIWAEGSPKRPETGLETVCAAIEAQQLGLYGEAEGYLSPALRQSSALEEIAQRCDLCTEMKYALPDGRPCAALIHLEGGSMAKAEPLYYRVSASEGVQGAYQIEELEVGS